MVQIPINPNQQGTFEMREEVLASAGAQGMHTSGYELSDLEEIQFSWENPQVDLDAIFRRKIDTPLSTTVLKDLEMGGRGPSGNPIVLAEEEDKDNSPPTIPLSERPTEPPRLLISRPFGRQIEAVPELVYRILFEYYFTVCVYDNIYKSFKYFITITVFFQTNHISLR